MEEQIPRGKSAKSDPIADELAAVSLPPSERPASAHPIAMTPPASVASPSPAFDLAIDHSLVEAPRAPLPAVPPRANACQSRLEHSLARDAPGAPSPQLVAGRYQVVAFLGKGGMGSVHRAWDSQLDRAVALKRVTPPPEADAASFATRFLAEAQALAAIEHPHVVRFFDCGTDAQGAFITMELLERNLGKVLADDPLTSSQVCRIAGQILAALAAVHRAGFVHRDVKPSNILFDAQGLAKLGDFGLVRQRQGPALTMTGAGIGTQAYAAPEQLRDARKVDGRADLYALGATLYHCLVGEHPRVVRESRIPEPFREFLLKALEESPERRFPDAQAMHDALAVVERELQASLRSTTGTAQQIPETPSAQLVPETSTQKISQVILRRLQTLFDAQRYSTLVWELCLLRSLHKLPKHVARRWLERSQAETPPEMAPCERCSAQARRGLMHTVGGRLSCVACMQALVKRVPKAYRRAEPFLLRLIDAANTPGGEGQLHYEARMLGALHPHFRRAANDLASQAAARAHGELKSCEECHTQVFENSLTTVQYKLRCMPCQTRAVEAGDWVFEPAPLLSHADDEPRLRPRPPWAAPMALLLGTTGAIAAFLGASAPIPVILVVGAIYLWTRRD